MVSLLRNFHFITLVVWIGGIVFFSFILTPTLFKQLSKEITSKVLDVVFPKYYFMGMVCSVLALITSFTQGLRLTGSTVLLLLMLAMTFYAGLSLYPKAHQLKIEIKGYSNEKSVPAEVKSQFKKTHKWAVILNMLVLIFGFIYIWCFLAKNSLL